MGSAHLDALPLLRAFCEDEGLVAVGALHPQEAVCSVPYPRRQNLVTQHRVDHRALPIARPTEQMWEHLRTFEQKSSQH